MAHAGDAVIAWTGPKRPKSSATPDTGHVLTPPGLAWIAHRNHSDRVDRDGIPRLAERACGRVCRACAESRAVSWVCDGSAG